MACLALEILVFFLSFVSTEIRIREKFLKINKYLLVLISICAIFLIIMTIIRFMTFIFFQKAKNIERKFTSIKESNLLWSIISTVIFCLITPNIFFESDKFNISIYDEETGTL